MTLPVLVFAAVLAVILIPYGLFVLRPETQDQQRLKKRLKDPVRKRATQQLLVKEVQQLSNVSALNALLERAVDLITPIRRLLEQSGTGMNVGSFVLATGCMATIPGLIVWRVSGHALAGMLVGAVTGLFPYLYVRRARTKRVAKFEENFPEGIDLIARALRAGHTFQTGLLMVADEIDPPVGTEFRMLYDRQNFGMPLPEALRDFAERVPLLDAKFFATAVLTQRDAGGNLAEVLDNLSSVIRDRFKVKRQIRVISAHGRITGWILVALPPSLATVFTILSPKQMMDLIEDPLGKHMVMAAIGLQVLGTLIIRKLINIEY